MSNTKSIKPSASWLYTFCGAADFLHCIALVVPLAYRKYRNKLIIKTLDKNTYWETDGNLHKAILKLRSKRISQRRLAIPR
jgi:hypothetical protein